MDEREKKGKSDLCAGLVRIFGGSSDGDGQDGVAAMTAGLSACWLQ